MTLLKIPDKLDGWTVEIPNQMITIPGVESEVLDFKGHGKNGGNRVPNISEDICAMANTSGGTLILGIDPQKQDGHTIGYTKNGYEKGAEDKVGLAISHRVNDVEPVSKYELKVLYENDKYFIIL
jgi:predicted HTH transcriptional regulator